jgi:hypothetical protein
MPMSTAIHSSATVRFVAVSLVVTLLNSVNAVAGSVTVTSGASITGNGSIAGTVTVEAGGSLAPGPDVGCLTVSDLILQPGSIVTLDVGGSLQCVNHDAIIVEGGVSIDGVSLKTPVDAAYTPAFDDELLLLSVGGPATGLQAFSSAAGALETWPINGVALSFEFEAGDGNDIALVYRRTPSDPVIDRIEVLANGEVAVYFSVQNAGETAVMAVTGSCSSGGSVVQGSGTVSPVMITGLDPDADYNCTITAQNSLGESTSLASLSFSPFLSSGLPIWLLYEATR